RALGELSLKDGDAETAIDFYFEARRIDPVRHNDRLGLLRAHTQLVWPFKHLLPLIHRLRRWPHSRQWTLYAATSTAVVGLLVLVQSSVLPWYVPPLVVLLAVNIVLLVHTGNKLAD